ncbi:MAG: ShlB/FhaC/HecB family hemolysin secretion/activation protein [Candidatus Omnitrophica bacterium]|nr:ShlB/FhaC/HecB family hemolysin secretion/activation protein [Candidatus Omnitrophota bacterium]MDE2221624.1 ShlB/FhaC/HecB family hemolysin secretion/activation protein [Candidatus Omnitrophota bacterium]
MKKILRGLTIGVPLCLFSGSSFAAVPAVPTSQDLQAQAERFQQQYSIEKRSRDAAIAKALIQAQEAQKAPAGPEVYFVLHSVRITGTTVFDPKYLDFVWKPYLNKRVSFNDLNYMVRLIKRVYKDLGFLTTTAYLPPQDINHGDVEIRVVEGKLGRLRVEGNRYFSTPSIAKYMHTYGGEVMDMGEMQRDVLRINQNRDLNVSAVLSPGQEPETVDVTLNASENLPWHASIGTDNQGTRLTGRFRRLVNLSTTNFSGHEDTLAFNGAYSDFSSGYYLSYQTPVGTNGIKLGLDAGYFQGKLGYEYKQYDITNYTEIYDPNAAFELYLSPDLQVDLRTGIQFQNNYKKDARTYVTDEKLRLPYVAMDVIKTDPWGQTSFSPELTFGAPGFLGASREDNALSSRPETDGFFTKYNQYLSRTQAMPWGSYIQIKSQFQAAVHTLPTSELLQLGGVGSVRGYPQGDYLADIGGYMDTDWYFPNYLIPPSRRWFGTVARNDVEPFVFYDIGAGRLYRRFTGEEGNKFLSSIGGGIRIHIKGNFYLKLEWALPVGNKPNHGSGPSTFDVSFQAGT